MTETDELARALDAAAHRWPELSRPRLLARLALEGHRATEAAGEQRRQDRISAIDRFAGVATGGFGSRYLEELRAEWPG